MLSDNDIEAVVERVYHRIRNTQVRTTLHLSDDSQPTQLHQTEGYLGELRDGAHRYGEFGHSSMPLPGAKAHALYHGGSRGLPTILGIEDPRYRPVGLKGGETQGYMVDGAAADGTGGTTRRLWQGLLGWIHNIFGKTINIGTQADTVTIAVNGKKVTITDGNGSTVQMTGDGNMALTGAGTLSVQFNQVDLSKTPTTIVNNLTIQGVESGGGPD